MLPGPQHAGLLQSGEGRGREREREREGEREGKRGREREKERERGRVVEAGATGSLARRAHPPTAGLSQPVSEHGLIYQWNVTAAQGEGEEGVVRGQGWRFAWGEGSTEVGRPEPPCQTPTLVAPLLLLLLLPLLHSSPLLLSNPPLSRSLALVPSAGCLKGSSTTRECETE